MILRLFKLEVFRISLFHVIVGNRGLSQLGILLAQKQTGACGSQSLKKSPSYFRALFLGRHLQSLYTEKSVLLAGRVDNV